MLHAYRAGHAHLDAYLDDYAYLIEAFLALFEATGDQSWVDVSVNLAGTMVKHFEDSQTGGFFYTADDGEELITRNKDWHDGSLISGNASATIGLQRLSRLCNRGDFRRSAERTLCAAADVLEKQSAACAGLLSALDRYANDDQQIVLTVPDQCTLEDIRPRLFSRYRPHTTVSWVVGDSVQTVVEINKDRRPIDGQIAVYNCRGFVCDQPLAGDQALQWLIEG